MLDTKEKYIDSSQSITRANKRAARVLNGLRLACDEGTGFLVSLMLMGWDPHGDLVYLLFKGESMVKPFWSISRWSVSLCWMPPPC